MYFCGTYRKIIIMANKTQMLLDLTVVDKLIVKLTNLKEFEHESLMRYDDVDLQTYLSIAKQWKYIKANLKQKTYNPFKRI